MKRVSIPFYLASRAIRRGNKGTLTLTILVVAMSFVLMVFLPSLVGGITGAYTRQVTDYQYGNLVIDPDDDTPFITDTREKIRMIKRVPGIAAASSHTTVSSSLTSDTKTLSRGVVAIIPSDDRKVINLPGKITEGRYLTDGDTDTILLGSILAGNEDESKDKMESLGGVRTGDSLSVTYSNGETRKMTISGIFETGSINTDSQAFITRKEMGSVLGLRDQSSSILVTIIPGNDLETAKNRLMEFGIREKVKTSAEKGEGVIGDAIKSFNLLTRLMSVFSLVIACIVIFIIVYINTINQRRQIGILKAIGIPEQDIIWDYLIQVVFIFCSGALLGFCIFSLIREYLQASPLQFPAGLVYPVMDFSIIFPSFCALGIVSLVAGVIPAYRTTSTEILELVNG
ncbi:MAG: FtsX-like permease family protein [Methanospirillum sp.]|uniref:ABC transporter permease n=1 Tax=Methanospirillum sp. TaxID=45200 RepID=UPI00236B238B|nr:FtsX-like permease family protein [Methanospirillum sp.]MDD1728137.1 FtsX-like permease family protein [Methanospirillum sp.]